MVHVSCVVCHVVSCRCRLSITAMEIFHGFLRKPYTPMHAFLYERDPSFMEDITEEAERRIFAFDSDDPAVREKRDSLKQVRVRCAA